MNLANVIESLVEERGLNRDEVILIICEGIQAAYEKKYPDLSFVMKFNEKSEEVDIFLEKTVVTSVQDADREITVRRAQTLNRKAKAGDVVEAPFEQKVGRIEVLAAKQVIANRIRDLEQRVVYDEFKEREGSVVTGSVHKRERAGYSVKIGDVVALLPLGNTISGEVLRSNSPVRALLKEVLSSSHGDYQLILDRTTPLFVQKLLELEIPEVFEGIVEIKKIERIPGYKTKIIVVSNSKEIDPVGTCVGVGGVRIKPILKELGNEKIDLIEGVENDEELVKNCLKPAEIDKIEFIEDDKRAVVWLAQDQRSYAIGKMGQNIALASRISGFDIQLQDLVSPEDELVFDEEVSSEDSEDSVSGFEEE